MNSLEALEEIRERFSDDAKGNNSWGFNISKHLQIIEKDLKEKEKLEKYNEDFRSFIDQLFLCIRNITTENENEFTKIYCLEFKTPVIRFAISNNSVVDDRIKNMRGILAFKK